MCLLTLNATTVPAGATFTVDSIGLATADISGGLTCRIITPGLVIGFGGGVTRSTGKLSFANPRVSGNIRFDYDEETSVFTNTLRPYGMLSLGLGKVGSKAGLLFNVSSEWYLTDLEFNDAFQIYTSSTQDQRIDLASDKSLELRVNFGLSFLF